MRDNKASDRDAANNAAQVKAGAVVQE